MGRRPHNTRYFVYLPRQVPSVLEGFYRTRAEDDHIELCYSGFAPMPDLWDYTEKTLQDMLGAVAVGYVREITREECPVVDNERGPLYPVQYEINNLPDNLFEALTEDGTQAE